MPHLVFAIFYVGAKDFELLFHARYFYVQLPIQALLIGRGKPYLKHDEAEIRDRTNFIGYFMNRQSVGICSCCPEVFLELFPINFWILPFKILIPTVEIYNRNSTRVPSGHISHFVLIPTYVGTNASPLGNILYT